MIPLRFYAMMFCHYLKVRMFSYLNKLIYAFNIEIAFQAFIHLVIGYLIYLLKKVLVNTTEGL